MLKKICYAILFTFTASAAFLSAENDYDIQDIGTLQTHSSEAIAINNQGQILGWYNIDGSMIGKHYFVRDRNGTFHEINEDHTAIYQNVPPKQQSIRIDWRYLTDDGRAYGTLTLLNDNPILFVWDLQNGMVKLGKLPGKEISAINNAGKVLIKSVEEYENGKLMKRPVIWDNGKITKLRGLEGDLGIESEESYGLDMNNQGEVVGQSLVYQSYKNNLYTQIHAVKWIDEQPKDLHTMIPKSTSSQAIAINDYGDMIIKPLNSNPYFIENNNNCTSIDNGYLKLNNICYIYSDHHVRNKERIYLMYSYNLNEEIKNDSGTIWMYINKIVSVNDNGEIIAQGQTFYGESHAMLLSPISK